MVYVERGREREREREMERERKSTLLRDVLGCRPLGKKHNSSGKCSVSQRPKGFFPLVGGLSALHYQVGSHQKMKQSDVAASTRRIADNANSHTADVSIPAPQSLWPVGTGVSLSDNDRHCDIYLPSMDTKPTQIRPVI